MDWDEMKEMIRKHWEKQQGIPPFYCARCGLVPLKQDVPCRGCGCTAFRKVNDEPVEWPEYIDLEEK